MKRLKWMVALTAFIALAALSARLAPEARPAPAQADPEAEFAEAVARLAAGTPDDALPVEL